MAFDIYKRGQGKYTRLCSAFAAAIIAGIGCYRLWAVLNGRDVGPWVETMVPAGLLVILCLAIFWAVNKHSVADFMISAEGEVKKVNWSSRKEITTSTIIVIGVVIVMTLIVGLADVAFIALFTKVIKI